MFNEEKVYGIGGEKVCSPTINTHFFDVLANNKVRAVFCGHDHYNNYGGLYKGVELSYGRKTGYGASGPAPLFMRGAREINFRESVKEGGNIEVELVHHDLLENGKYSENGKKRK